VSVHPAVRDRARRAAATDSSLAAALAAVPADWRTSILFKVRLAGSSPDRQQRALDRLPSELRQWLRRWLADHRDVTPLEVVVEGLADFYGPEWLQAQARRRHRTIPKEGS
jgi:hypothetical protein